MARDPRALERMRRAWGCDCDGERPKPPTELDPSQIATSRALDAIEMITAHRPHTCPWRSYYDPLVREVMSISWAIENGNLPALLSDDSPHILFEAVGVYRMSLLATLAEDRRLRQQREKNKPR